MKNTQWNSPTVGKKTSCIMRLPRKVFIVVSGFLLLCFVGVYLIEIPRFLTLPILPPDLYIPGSNWYNTTTSVQTWPPPIPPFYAKYFIWRRETTVFYNEAHGIVSWQSVVDYFDDTLSQLGWVRYTAYIPQPCELYLPESNFLEPGENGYVTYRKPDFQEFNEQPLICLAVWAKSRTDDGTPDAFGIVLLTARPSPFTILSKALE